MSKTDTAPQGLLSEQLMDAAVGVLGSMLIDDAAIGPMLMAVSETDFQDSRQRNIFRAFRELYGAGKPADPILVNQHLGGGYGEYLTQLMERTPTAAHADDYAEALKKTSRLWQLRQIGEELTQADDADAGRALLDKANLLLCDRPGIRRLSMTDGLKLFLQRQQGKPPEYLHWGFGDLDEQLHVGPGDMVVVGGYPSAGKTALALQMGFTIGRKKRVGFFSYETDAGKLFDRTVACQTGTSFGRIMVNKLGEADYRQIYDHRTYLAGSALELIEANGMTVSDIGAYAMAHHYDVIAIDYLQKIPATSTSRYGSDFERVSQVSNDLQQLGRRTGKTVLALSQLSRPEKTKSGDTKPPRLSDLRQSGQIEQDADVVLLLYKEYPDMAFSPRLLDIAKNKDGVSGLGLRLNFDGDKQRFAKAVGQPAPKKEPPAQQDLFHPVAETGATPFDREVS